MAEEEEEKSDGSLSPAFSKKHVELSISARRCRYIWGRGKVKTDAHTHSHTHTLHLDRAGRTQLNRKCDTRFMKSSWGLSCFPWPGLKDVSPENKSFIRLNICCRVASCQQEARVRVLLTLSSGRRFQWSDCWSPWVTLGWWFGWTRNVCLCNRGLPVDSSRNSHYCSSMHSF